MHPTKYRKENNLDAKSVIAIVRGCGYEGHDRATLSRIENGNKTGARLMPDAEKAVKEKYPGYWKTLPSYDKSGKRKPNRKNDCQFTVRTTKEFKDRILRAKEFVCCSSLQDFILMALEFVVQGIEKAASDAGTSKTAKDKTVNESITWTKENVNETHN